MTLKQLIVNFLFQKIKLRKQKSFRCTVIF